MEESKEHVGVGKGGISRCEHGHSSLAVRWGITAGVKRNAGNETEILRNERASVEED